MHQSNHLFWRAAFGPTPAMLAQDGRFKSEVFFDALVQASKNYNALQTAGNLTEGLAKGLNDLGTMERMSQEERKEKTEAIRKARRQEIKSLNLLWLEEMTHSNGQLREKMAFFWHGHFACRNLNSFYQQQLLEVIRSHALGNFGEMLSAVSKTPAMLQFLNNQQNRKQTPNENFAREVMELFTLGIGHYIEKDVSEAARAFTGWGFNLQGEFVFRSQLHDAGTKTILGKSGNMDGDDVIALLLEKPETAEFIAGKLYRFLVSDTVIDQERIKKLGRHFYDNHYNIIPLLEAILTPAWFYDRRIATPRIKSPIEFWVGLRRLLSLELAYPEVQLLLQRNLGQVLFYPPNVAGWPGGKNWIDGSSLLLRMRLAGMAAASRPVDVADRPDDDSDMGRNNPRRVGQLQATANPTQLIDALKQHQRLSYRAMAAELLQTSMLPAPEAILDQSAADDHAQWHTISNLLMSPEYQLC